MPRPRIYTVVLRTIVTAETYTAVRQESERRGQSVSEILRLALDEYLDNHKLHTKTKSKGWESRWGT